jgi:hypothetical protein
MGFPQEDLRFKEERQNQVPQSSKKNIGVKSIFAKNIKIVCLSGLCMNKGCQMEGEVRNNA